MVISATAANAQPLGLTQTWPKDNRPTTMDIVALHGLDSRSERTYMAYATEGDTNSRRVHWLRDDDMLPAQFPTARIFTYDWRSNTYDGASTQHFHTHAHTLLSHLSRARRGDKAGKPLLFVSSCFGGLVAAKAFTMAAGLREFADIYDSASGFVFIGTPFRGGQGSSIFRSYIRINRMLGKVSSHELTDLVDMDKNDSRLDEIRTQFCDHALQKWGAEARKRVFCFYETDPTMVLRAFLPRWAQSDGVEKFARAVAGDKLSFLFVTPESACLDAFGREALNVRHAMSNKFRGPDDQNFLTIASCMGDMATASQIVPQKSPKVAPKLAIDELAFVQIVLNEHLPKALNNNMANFLMNSQQKHYPRRAFSTREDTRRHSILI